MITKININPYKADKEKRKTFACAYCGDIFKVSMNRDNHEKKNHVDNEGNLLQIVCDICQEILPGSMYFRRHAIDMHKKYNHTLVKKRKYCCDECGKVFNVRIYLIFYAC